VAQTTQQMRTLQVAFTRTSTAMLEAVRQQAESTTASATALQERQSALAGQLAGAAAGIVESSGEFKSSAGQLVVSLDALETRLGTLAEALIREATGTREQVTLISSSLASSGGEAVLRELSGLTERVEQLHRDLSSVDTSLGYQGAISGRLDRVRTAVSTTTEELSSAARRFKELGKPTASIDRSLNAVKKSIADVLAAGSGLQVEKRRNLQAMSVLVLSLLVVTETAVVAVLLVTRP
jgi:chromosome segregation ATPase